MTHHIPESELATMSLLDRLRYAQTHPDGLRRGWIGEAAERIRELENAILDLLLAEQEHGYYSNEFYAAKRAAEAAAKVGGS